MSVKLFISYSRQDSPFTDVLTGQLESQGYNVWIDRQDISGGTSWRAEIVEAIRSCDVFLVVVSPNSAASANVAKEVALADDNGKHILPIRLAEAQLPPKLEYLLADLQMVDFSHRIFQKGMEQLLRVLPPVPGQRYNLPAAPKAQGKGWNKALIWILAVLGVGAVGVMCAFGGLYAASLYQGSLTQTPTVSVVSVVEPTQPVDVVILPSATPVPPQATMIPVSGDALLFQTTRTFLENALIAEQLAYRNNDATLVAFYYDGEPLQNIQNAIQAFAANDLVYLSQLNGEKSRLLQVRQVNETTVVADTCEYWSADVYTTGGIFVTAEPERLVPQTITIEVRPAGWVITQIQFFEPPWICP